ncbi:two-component system CheB/CheR fusion protein [Pseudonocardia sediminis]|uniref:protein-glutamate O-methyltransferase n=1 Tax=Pseudonocardia sediminis TaxID=1397368 RepID=A0A4Q7UXI3_PSEST|nr:CheR family methyltransferase [Pseudonocardia sediminis]RZT86732.1 two-component system CheB/CheR fusion protein [Pseudonocardia sediminis]
MAENPPADPENDPVTDPGIDDGFEALLTHLRETRGFDFTGYKRTSLRRRIQHRMDQVGIEGFAAYVDHLEVTPDEFAALFNTILINVTGFFRDPDTWSYLRTDVLPGLLEARPADTVIRVWCAGCASGEEAYTIAILLAELLGPEEFGRRVKIYATDVDEDALAYARAATYTERELQGVPADLRERWFEPVGSRHAFRKDLRRSVIFGRNDLVQDAPISRIDLLSCRNTLMYFTPQTQAGMMSRFRFALAPHGVLVLGRAEMLLSHGRLFEPIDLKSRVFRKNRSVAAGVTPMSPEFVADRRGAGTMDRLREHALAAGPVPQIVLTGDDVVALANQRAEELLGVGARDVGRPLRDLEVSYRPVELRSVVERVRMNRTAERITEVRLERAGETRWFAVDVAPLVAADGGRLGVSVAFHDVSAAHRLQGELERANAQLESLYEELQSTSEELETTNEELQSTVEELETTNEELQSTNEELETMNEELRSSNDELQSTNDEVRVRSGQLDGVNEFLESILSSLRSGVIVLDRQLQVTVWNAVAEEMWGLRREEVLGQHVFNLDMGLPTDGLRTAARKVLADRDHTDVLEVDAVNRRGRTVTVRIAVNPLLGTDGAVSGCVLLMD